ncbi:MAG: Foldase protein PrsA 3 precursor [Chloroflexi bacterium ADurb.Bin180]|nr:MAG: Foldase protein PrsA 3 precursor [Chloroflexi bacterium ADurb.Bin180]
MPKVKPTEPITKKQLSRREQERRQQRILGIVFGLTAAAVLFVLGFGWYQEYVAKPSAPVATVNGKAISTRDYQAMVKYNDYELRSTIARAQSQLDSLDATNEDQTFLVSYMQQQIQQLRTKRSSVGLDTYDQMVDDELIRQEAYDRNPPTPTPTPITATVDSSVTPQPTRAPMTQTEFETNYGSYVAALRKNLAFSEQTFRRLFESSLYHTKLQEALALEVSASEEQVHARHILVATEDEANKVLERLHAGEDFAALAKELSTDTGSKEEGGDLGWFPRGMMVTEFENAAFALQPGQTSEPVKTSFGYHIINVIERDANRPLDEATLDQKKSRALDNWLTTQRNSGTVIGYWSSAKVPNLSQ